ncbi:hypothetical protein L208DRAFT_1322558, partial [Tricholoma matsutake]
IVYFEALSVAGAINDLHTSVPDTSKIIIHTDSMNTVNIFNSLRCLPEFNPLLKYCVDVFLHKKFDTFKHYILHIPGTQNVVADVISHCEFVKAQQLVPGLTITPFQPPHFNMMGAVKK